MLDLFTAADKVRWKDIPDAAIDLAEKSAGTALDVRELVRHLPTDGFRNLWYQPASQSFHFDWVKDASHDVIEKWSDVVGPLGEEVYHGHDNPATPGWAKLLSRPLAARCFAEKSAESPTMSALSQAVGYKKGPIPGTPNALIGSLTGGLLGAGLGYGTGWLGEKVLPEKWRGNKRLRKTLAILGGLAGATPGIIGMYSNDRAGRPFYQNAPPPGPGENLTSVPKPQFAQRAQELGLDVADPDAFKQWDKKYYPGGYKASSMTGWEGMDWPEINVPDFARRVWEEPRLSNEEQAATSGLVQGASAMKGGNRFVSPMDVGRIAAGMGSGYLSGALVGKVLGTLAGMPTKTQDRLRNVGLWAGVVKSVVPMVFGG